MWRRVLVLWCASRVALIGLGVILTTRIGWHRTIEPWQTQPWQAVTGWDSVYYIRIAHDGYHAGRTVAFFPFYPLLIRGFEAVTGLGDAIASLAVANVALLVAMVGLYVLARDRWSEEHARRGLLYLILSPYACLLVLAYSEGVFLALVAWLFVFSDRRRDALAIPLGIAAGLTRVNGMVLVLPLALVAWRRRTVSSWLLAVSPVLGLVLHAAWLQHAVGDPLAFVHAQSRWGGHVTLPPLALVDEVQAFMRDGGLTHLESVLAVIVYLALLIPLWRSPVFARQRLEDTLYVIGIFALPLFSGVIQSAGRFGLLAFPLFFALADIGMHRQLVHRLYIVFAPVVQITIFGYVALGYLVP
ncbi:MAG: mannosyltransferase family protein [Gaiellales bacterium]